MEEKKIDRRVRKTKKQLRYALTTLLQQKPIQEIRVSEIAELIDINRGTFYQHYTDMNDLLISTENEILDELQTVLRETKVKMDRIQSVQNISKALDNFMITLLTYIKDNHDLIKALFGKYGDHGFIIRVKELVKREWLTNRFAITESFDETKIDYYFGYLASGTIEIITIWLENGMQESPEEMATLIQQILMQGAQSILY